MNTKTSMTDQAPTVKSNPPEPPKTRWQLFLDALDDEPAATSEEYLNRVHQHNEEVRNGAA